MAFVPYALTRPFLFGLDPEQAHDLTLGALARVQRTPLACVIAQARVDDPVDVAGLRFPNRLGLAAGLDKNGRCIDAFGTMGFGFVEVGTVTPKAQPGNPKPRMFRLPDAQALINRLGFNNEGLDAFVANVKRARFRSQGGILGLNIGKNAATPIERAIVVLVAITPSMPFFASVAAITATCASSRSGAILTKTGTRRAWRRSSSARRDWIAPSNASSASSLCSARRFFVFGLEMLTVT